MMYGPGSELTPSLTPAGSYSGTIRRLTLMTGLVHAYQERTPTDQEPAL